jgi:predicted dehydrogenase
MKTSQLRAGVIGTGFIGPVHIEALRRIGVKVTAICDTAGRARSAADRFAIPGVYEDYRRLVESPEVDVVHITAPNRFHCAMALAALRAGKHVVCEKPLAMNLAEASRMVEAVRNSPSVFAVNYNVRFYPAVLELRHRIADGDLGSIYHVNGSYFQDWLFKETDYNWRLLPKEGGRLRAVADIGTHWMDTASFILGAPIASVFAELATVHPHRKRPLGEVQTFSKSSRNVRYARYRVQTEDFANVLIHFQNGARGNLAVSQVAAGRKNSIRLEIYGSKKSAAWDSEHPEQLQFGNRDEANAVAVRNTPAFGAGAGGYADYPAGHVEGFPDTFKMLFRSIYGVVARGGRGERLFASAADGQHEIAVCEAILRSHRAKRWVNVET